MLRTDAWSIALNKNQLLRLLAAESAFAFCSYVSQRLAEFS